MISHRRWSCLASLPVALGLLACDSAPVLLEDAGAPADDAATDALTATLDALAPLDDAASPPDAPPRGDAGPQPAFEVPRDREWHFVEVPGAVCANGSTMGIALNLDPTSDRLVFFMQGGGACWDGLTCVLAGTASHLRDTLTESIVLSEARSAGGFVMSRTDMENPYRDQSYAFVPYCTADVHVGNAVQTYRSGRSMLTVEHRGAPNTELILARLAASFPTLDRLTMVGISAGGYGVAVNAFRGRMAFPSARVDVLDDSGIVVDAEPGQWAEMMAAWQPPLPTDCPECIDGFTNLIPYNGRAMPTDARFGMLASRMDDTIRGYFGYTGTELARRVDESVATMGMYPNQRAIVFDGSRHVLLSRPDMATTDGTTVREWVQAFASDDPAWGTVGP